MKTPDILMLNMDCMEYMAQCKDKAFDLAIVDPPYAVGASDGNFGGSKHRPARINGLLNGKNYANHDVVPEKLYFEELFRISNNQIIWGFNYYPEYLYHSGAIVWDKKYSLDTPLSDCELAWQSFNKLVKKYFQAWQGATRLNSEPELRIHPNQKPIGLYKWILKTYAKPGQRIFDSHGGSFSSAIACAHMGFDFVGCELDKDYFELAKARFERETRQTQLFDYEDTADQPIHLPASHGSHVMDCFATP
jgi:site-specific DNA-methyltransferase (adenine-specific)